MKVSDYANQQGVRYETAWRWFQRAKAKDIASRRTIMIDEGREVIPTTTQKAAVYVRVSSAENKPNLESQAEQLVALYGKRLSGLKSVQG